MNRNAILNAMEKAAKEIFEDNPDYTKDGKRGMMVVDIRDPKNPDQWDSSCRNFGTVFRDYQYEGELVISNGTNFDALAHGKVAFCRRTNLNSGTNYYQVLGYESFWKGAVISDDGKCICAYSGFMGVDDEAIAQAGITCYESLKRTGKSLVTGGDPDHEPETAAEEPADSDEGTQVSVKEKPVSWPGEEKHDAENSRMSSVIPEKKGAVKPRGRKR